ncbi:hypothetical protein Tco_1213681 [Tanacetum coccineum]
MIQMASHLSPDAVVNIQTASPESGLESSSIFTPVSYLVRFLPKLSQNHVLKQGESINVQYLETNLYWEFGKFASRDGESLESYYSRLYKMMNELVRIKCNGTNHQVNVQFLLQLQPKWQRFVTLVKQSQELKTVSYHKLYDILKQHQHKFDKIRAKRQERTANPLALVAQQQPAYHPQNYPTHYTQKSSTRSQQATTRNRGKAIVNSLQPTYDQEPAMVAEDDEISMKKEIDKLIAFISLSFKKIYKPTNNNLRPSSNTSRANQDNTLRINRGTGYDNQRAVNVAGARETVGTKKPKRAMDETYHKENMLLCKQEEAGIQMSAEQVDWRDDTDDEPDDQELEAHYLYMAQIQEVIPDAADNSGPIFDAESLQKDDQDDNDDLAKERDLLASLIEKLKCEINDSKNRNKLLESSNKILVDKLTCQIEDFKNTNKSLESSNTRFKEANNELSKTNQLMFKDLKKFQDELAKRHDVNYMSKISDMKKELVAHQETISIMSQQKEDQKKFYKTREEKELEKVIALENKIKVLDDIVYKTGQSIQTMNTLNRNCKMSFVKPEFPKKAQRANPRLYDIAMSKIDKNSKDFKENQSKVFLKEHEQYFKIQDLKAQLQDKGIAISELKKLIEKMKGKFVETKFEKPSVIRQHNAFKSQRQSILGVIPTTSFSRPQLKSNQLEDRVMPNNSQRKKQEVEDHRRNFKFSNNKTFVTTCNDSLNAKTSNVNFVCVTCGKCVPNDNHDMCVLHYMNSVNSRIKQPIAMPISTKEPKRTMNQSVATPFKRTVALESTNQKPRSKIKKQYE